MTLSANLFLQHEAHALLTRLDRVRPLVLGEAMAPAANLSRPAQIAMERYLAGGRAALRARIEQYLEWLHDGAGDARTAQRRFSVLRMLFNRVLTQLDLFADAVSQRSEIGSGVWLAGLDALAEDGLALPGRYESPPLICYLDRGIGAAIRRARTRLPGGGQNPVAIIRVPRERMIGTGVASSLLHEVGHQGAALLDLVNSLRPVLNDRARAGTGHERRAWAALARWISEVVADLWSVARIGATSTVGLIGVVSLPRRFVFRMGLDDPHPFPWIRVKISAAIGDAFFPDPQWAALGQLWERFYPPAGLDSATLNFLHALEGELPEFIELLTGHRPARLKGASLAEALNLGARSPARLRVLMRRAAGRTEALARLRPGIAVAALGQARLDGALSPRAESRVLAALLNRWALDRALAPCPPGAEVAARTFPAVERSRS